jgi:hypothetical protein
MTGRGGESSDFEALEMSEKCCQLRQPPKTAASMKMPANRATRRRYLPAGLWVARGEAIMRRGVCSGQGDKRNAAWRWRERRIAPDRGSARALLVAPCTDVERSDGARYGKEYGHQEIVADTYDGLDGIGVSPLRHWSLRLCLEAIDRGGPDL